MWANTIPETKDTPSGNVAHCIPSTLQSELPHLLYHAQHRLLNESCIAVALCDGGSSQSKYFARLWKARALAWAGYRQETSPVRLEELKDCKRRVMRGNDGDGGGGRVDKGCLVLFQRHGKRLVGDRHSTVSLLSWRRTGHSP
jgi:hypothetical protein